MTHATPRRFSYGFYNCVFSLVRRVCPACFLVTMLFSLAASPLHASTATTTSLAVTPASPVTAGAVATLTASVKENGVTTVTSGTILFYDSFAPNLPIGTAQLTSAGIASMRKVFGVGSHGLTARFVPTTADAASTSTVQTLVVAGTGSYASSVSLGDDTSNGDTLDVTAQLNGAAPANGDVTIHSSVTNSTLGTVTLVPKSFGQSVKATFPTPTTNVAVITGDFNGDGLPDIATVNSSGKVDILLGHGDGTFTTAAEYPVGNGAVAIVAGDFNHDGKVDLAVTNTTDNTVSILIGVGDGTFLGQATFTTGPSPIGIATADMTGDGELDLIVADSGSVDGNGDAQVEIFTGKGDGTFVSTSTKIVLPTYEAEYVAVGDLNGDGLPDIVVSSQPSVIEIILQKSDRTFAAPVTSFGDSGMRAVVIADFNNDGKLDILVNVPSTTDFSGSVDIYLGNGDGTFPQHPANYPSTSASQTVIMGDFNHDGILDYAVGNNSVQGFFGTSLISAFLGVGDGTFNTNISQTFSAVTVDYPQGVAAADFTGNGLLDFVGVGQDNDIAVNLGYQTASGTLPNITVIQEDMVTGTYVPGTADAYATSTSPSITLEPPSYFYDLVFEGSPDEIDYTAGDTPAPLLVDVLQNESRSATAAFPITLTVKGPTGANAVYMQTSVNGQATFNLPVFTTAGTYAVTAHTPDATGGDATVSIVVSPGVQTATSLFISSPYPSHASQGIAAPVTISVLDQFGNADLAFRGTVALTTTDAAALLTPASHTFVAADSGVFTFNAAFNTIGAQSITVSSAGLTSIKQTGIMVLNPSVTTLSFSSTPVNSLSPVVLQATVTVGGKPAMRGTVNFYDSFASPKLIATAQLNASGQASITEVLGAGTHPIVATFTGNLTAGSSSSANQTLLVTPKQNYVSTNLLNGGGQSIYEIADGAAFFGRPRPTGVVNFIDTNHGNAILQTATLSSPFYSFTVNTDDTPVGIAPFAIVKGDFNGDGQVDVAVVNSNSTDNTVSVLLNNGGLAGTINPDGTVANSISYSAPLIYAVGSRPVGIAVGDFNADGKLDLAVANSGDNTVSVLLGNGDGTFQPALTLNVGNAPIGIATGDIDADGNLDLLIANSGDGTLSVLRGKGDGTFNTQTTLTVGSGPQNIALADLNGDGSLDIAVTNGLSNTVSVLLGNGDGTYKPAATLSAGSSPYAIVALDVAGTGKVSLAATNMNDATVSFFKANGDGTFQTPVTLSTGSQPTALAIGDFYNSGYLDLAVSATGEQTNTVRVYYGDSNGNFINGNFGDLGASGPNPQGIVAADVSGVGLTDLIIAGKSASNQYDGLISRPAVSVLPVLQTYGEIGYISIPDADNHSIAAVYVPGTNDAYGPSSSVNHISVPGTQEVSPELTLTPTGPLTAGVVFPNVKAEADIAGAVDTGYTGPLTLRVAGLDVPYSKSYTLTAVAGKASFAVTPPTIAGTYRFYISLGGINEVYIINTDVLVVAAAPSQVVIKTPFISPAARGVSGVVGAAVEDTYGNVVTNYTGTVNIATSDSAAVLHPASHTFISNDAGYASFAVTFNTTGTQSITASASGLTSGTQNGIVVIAPQLTTTTTLAFTPGSPQPAQTPITLTATVTDSTNAPVTLGVVNFYDTAASPHLIASSPLTSAGSASIKINFAVGTHGISATFQPKNADQGSSSGTQTLVISPAANYITQTALTNTGSPASYSLLATVGAFGAALPTGNVSFLDTSNGNAVVGTGTLGTGSSAFATQVPYTTDAGPGDVIEADFNGDGKADLAVLNTYSGTISLLLGKGDGTFGAASPGPLPDDFPTHMASGDFNGDGKLDLAIVNSDGTLTILLGNGDGTFQAGTQINGLFASSDTSSFMALSGIAVGDFNRDGKQDIAISNVIDGTVLIMLGYGDGTFQHPVFYAGETGPRGLAVADLNSDGYPDLVIANSDGDTVSVLLGNGDGTFGQQATYAVQEVPTQVAIADFNGDGKPDVAVTNQGSGTVSILLGKGDGTLLPPVTSATGNGPTNLIAGDFDSDGKQDVVVINEADNTAALLLGKGDGTLGASAPFTTGPSPDGLAAGDFTGSGRLSLAVSSVSADSVSVLLGEELYPAPLTGVTFPGTGLHKVKAVYNTGTADAYASSTSPTINLYGAATPIPTVVITSSKSPATLGTSITLTATVSSGTAGTITGSVAFYDGTTLLGSGTISAGKATFSTSALNLGGHAITGVYAGDSTYANATSPVFQQVIGAVATSKAVLVSSGSPAIVGQSVTFTVTVTSTAAGTPTGTVQFFSDGTSIGTGTLNSSATTSVSTSTLASGSHSITAAYSGDATFQASNAFAITQTISKVPSTTLLSTATTQIENEGPDLFTATVTGTSGTPTGKVSFSDGTTNLATVALNSSGVATFNDYVYPVGAHNIVATYLGDTTYAGSASPTVVVNIVLAPNTTTVTATASPNPAVTGTPVTVNITVKGSNGGFPTGQVSVLANTSYDYGDATLDASGKGSVQISNLQLGENYLTISYFGDTNYQASNGSIRVDIAPDAKTPILILTSSLNPSLSGQPVTFTATVKTVSGAIPTGTVSFTSGFGDPVTVLGTGTLNNAGVATFTTSSLAADDFSYFINATYNGDTNFTGGGTDFVTQQVNQGPKLPSTTALTVNPNPVAVGASVTLSAFVSSSFGSQPPSGTVTFYDGARLLMQVPLGAGNISTFTISSLPSGSHNLTAAYNGDSFFDTSVATATPLTVGNGKTATTTSVPTSSLNPSNSGQSITFTATVTSGSGTPTGTVTFSDGATPLGTGTLTGGAASFSTTALTVGPHSITASYGGDTNDAASASASALTQTVNAVVSSTTTVLTASANPATFGQSVILTATINSSGNGTPTGSVTFKEGATILGTGTVSGGKATYTTSSLSTTSHTITAVYAGDTDFSTSTSSPLTEVISQASSSTTALTSSINNVVEGTSVTFTATVTSTTPGTLTGSVNFLNGASLIGSGTLNSGVATFTTTALAVGMQSITAVYAGDTNFPTSTSNILVENINQAPTTTSLSTSNGSVSAGQSVTFTATVATTAAGTPAGNVSFYDGATLLGTSPLSGLIATYSTSALIAGPHTITATYVGDTTFQTSTSTSLHQIITALAAASTTSIVSSLNPAQTGQSITFTATITTTGDTTPTGNVTFFDGATLIETTPLAANKTAAFSTSTLTAGSHTITATYAGDTNFNGSTSLPLTQVINGVVSSTTTVIASTLNPASAGQSVTINATISTSGSIALTGNVSFFDGATLLSSTPISAAKTASFTTSAFAVGSHIITATYAGDANYTTSTSLTLTQVINKAVTTTALTSSANPSTPAQSVTFTATPTSVFAGTPTGTVVFNDGGTLLSTVTLTSTTAIYTTSTLSTGSHTITATYSGDGTFAGSTSSNVVQVVGPLVPPDFSLTTSTANQTIAAGGAATYSITATAINGAYNTPVALSVTGNPPGSTVTFSPAGITPGSSTATSVLTIQTALLTGLLQTTPKFIFAALLLLLPALRRRSRSLPRLMAIILFGVISLGAVFGITGCGGGGYFGQTRQSYTLTITGASGSTQHSTTVTLNVQ